MIDRPREDEYADFYAPYLALVPGDDAMVELARQIDDLRSLADATPAERGGYRYAEGKWSVREVLGHLIDAERIFSYRALRFSRGDTTPLPGFDENLYVAASDYDRATLSQLAEELVALRRSNLALLDRLSPEACQRVGTANGRTVSVRALAFIMAGHVRHHLGVLAERYGVKA
ncbi:MAG TPA: DinB family protein [Thermoanaerobaculia bacterium]|nr:DinB family protein [Thermoanaerobaculia bacterium]